MKKSPDKKKPRGKYSLYSNFRYIVGNLWEWDKKTLGAIILKTPAVLLVALIGVYLPKILLSNLESGQSAMHLIGMLAILTVGYVVGTVIEKGCQARIHWGSADFRENYVRLGLAKICDTDYSNVEEVSFKDRYQKYLNENDNEWGVTEKVLPTLQMITSDGLGFLLFAGMISSLNPWLVLVIAVTTGVHVFFLNRLQKIEEECRSLSAHPERKNRYVLYCASNFGMGKDIRLYRIKKWLLEWYHKSLAEVTEVKNKQFKARVTCNYVHYGMIVPRDAVAYGYLIWQVLYHDMAVSDFVLYFGIITELSGWLYRLLMDIHKVSLIHDTFCMMREFLDYKDSSNRKEGKELPPFDSPCSITFEEVSFLYPDSQKPVIDHFNLHIEAGEKIALVGMNGAGKTTLVKLLCGFYQPSQGRILVNGTDIREFNRDAYYEFISAVFQDVQFMPVSIMENVGNGFYDMDEKKLKECLELSGMEKKMEKLPNGLKTLLGKGIRDEAIDLSGGERQKLLLARAIYKECPILILDEPTAALDPIAERDMYLSYAQFANHKTSIFISHRLSSTRFCNRIVLLEHGRVAEIGSHAELLRIQGKYAQMFNVQSRYYEEEAYG